MPGKNNPRTQWLVRAEAAGFLGVNAASDGRPRPTQGSASGQPGAGACLPTAIAGCSPLGFSSEPHINKGVLTYIICCHNNTTLCLQNTLKWGLEAVCTQQLSPRDCPIQGARRPAGPGSEANPPCWGGAPGGRHGFILACVVPTPS